MATQFHSPHCFVPGTHSPMELYVLLGPCTSHMLWFGTMLTGMERVSLPQKWLLEPITFPDATGESIIPPPFLEQWKAFLELLSSHNFQGNEVDAIVLPLIPMFHTEAYILPLRILKEQEVIQLSGLHDFWNNVSLSDAE